MKRTRKSTGLIIGLIMTFVLTAGMAQAYSFSDMIDDWTLNLPWPIGEIQVGARPIVEGSPFVYQHDIRDSVNFAAGDRVTSATLQLDFTNDIPCLELFLPCIFAENVRVAYDGTAWHTLGDVDNGQYEITLDTAYLNDNGRLTVTIEVTSPCLGTAWLDHSYLYGEAQCASVPEPGSLILLGLGLIGVVALGRRKLWK